MQKLATVDATKKLNALYEELAFELDDGNQGHFLSGWQCENPYVSDLLASVKERANYIDHRCYTYFDEDEGLANKIREIHTSLDGVPPQSILCTAGSTALLYAFVTYLKRIGVKKVCYIPPLYFTLHIAFELYGICARPISNQHPFEEGFSIKLPKESHSVLFLTDPVWYTGTKYSVDVIKEIAEWQERTSSLVFVDGSLQYLPWNGVVSEHTSQLPPSHTFRLVCPSKQLSIHGYRFSYLLLPSSHERSMAWTYANIAGPAPADSIAFAHEAMIAVADRIIPNKLMQLAVQRHSYLRTQKLIESDLTPQCGYFVFERIHAPLPQQYPVVDGKYFSLSSYPCHIKINLLSPSLRILGDVPDGYRS